MNKQELVTFINANWDLKYSITEYTQEQLEGLLSVLEDEELSEALEYIESGDYLVLPNGDIMTNLPI
jgi:hypothetical protein